MTDSVCGPDSDRNPLYRAIPRTLVSCLSCTHPYIRQSPSPLVVPSFSPLYNTVQSALTVSPPLPLTSVPPVSDLSSGPNSCSLPPPHTLGLYSPTDRRFSSRHRCSVGLRARTALLQPPLIHHVDSFVMTAHRASRFAFSYRGTFRPARSIIPWPSYSVRGCSER